MKEVFVDTFYYLALLNPRDGAHHAAVAASHKSLGLAVTTAWVLTEVADAFAEPVLRQRFLDLYDMLHGESVTIVPSDPMLFDRGVDLYRARPDKSWSLTDCISFVVMKERGITEALTGDQHFRQAGFVALF